jgi:hypothetical protein
LTLLASTGDDTREAICGSLTGGEPMVKRVLKWIGALIVGAVVLFGGFVGYQVMAFNKSMDKTYDVPLPNIQRSTDSNVIARGKHLTESIGACAIRECHGPDFSGGPPIDLGPIGILAPANITTAGKGAQYSDGELARLIMHGIKRDGKPIRFMPIDDFNWLPDDDIQAIISFVRSMPAVNKPEGPVTHIGVLGKVLDRLDKFKLDPARRMDHSQRKVAPAPEPTAKYGQFIAQMCQGCHGEHFSGGPIPGAPPNLPIPLNITPDETGIKLYTFDDFNKLLDTGVRKNGNKLNPFMPIEALGKMNPIERQALWSFLQTVPAQRFGRR